MQFPRWIPWLHTVSAGEAAYSAIVASFMADGQVKILDNAVGQLPQDRWWRLYYMTASAMTAAMVTKRGVVVNLGLVMESGVDWTALASMEQNMGSWPVIFSERGIDCRGLAVCVRQTGLVAGEVLSVRILVGGDMGEGAERAAR